MDNRQKYSEDYQNKRRLDGLCYKCGGTIIGDYTRCLECRKKEKKIYEAKKAKGLCVRCQIRKPKEGYVVCKRCIGKGEEYKKKIVKDF